MTLPGEQPTSRWTKALNAIVLVLLLGAMAELAARVWGGRLLPRGRSLDALPGEPVPGEPNMVVDSATGWRARVGTQQSFGIPGGTYVNALGLRGPELAEKTAGARRLLFLGDSTVFGVLVADGETFVDRAASGLRAAEPTLEVLNGGAPGYTSWQALRALESRLLGQGPDLVVIATLWSDAQGTDVPDAERFPRSSVPGLPPSHLYLFTREWLNHVRFGGKPEAVTHGLGAARALLRVPLPDYEANLRTIATIVRAAGSDVAFLGLPCIKDPTGLPIGDHRDAYRAAMRAVAEDLAAPIVDTSTRFIGTRPEEMFLDEVHPTSVGHARIAEAIVEELGSWTTRPRRSGAE